MNETIRWIAAEAERPEVGAGGFPFGRKRRYELDRTQDAPSVERLPAHSFGAGKPGTTKGTKGHEGNREGHECRDSSESARELGQTAAGDANDLQDAGGNPHFSQSAREMGHPELGDAGDEDAAALEVKPTAEERQRALDLAREEERVRRIYRGRTVAMLRRYLRYSIECGRLPSILGSEFFRAQVTSYTVVTFEDRVIFVHDMETCLEKLDEFSRQLIGRLVLQEHDRWATAKLLHCNEKTVRRLTPMALDMLGEILLDVGLLERVESNRENSCQGGLESEISVSDCEDGKYKV